MKEGIARGGIADGEKIQSRFDKGVLVVDRIKGICQLYEPFSGTDSFVPKWTEPRPWDEGKSDETAAGPDYDVVAHPRAGE